MLRLILIRHAKSSWSDHSLPDHDRPLNARGQTSCTAIGDWLRSKGFVPDSALVSTARRTQETFERLGFDCSVRYDAALYHASASEMMQVLNTGHGKTLMMIGHNPGIAQFAQELANALPAHPRFYDYPTCATWVASFPANTWQEVEWRSGHRLDFAIPRELM